MSVRENKIIGSCVEQNETEYIKWNNLSVKDSTRSVAGDNME